MKEEEDKEEEEEEGVKKEEEEVKQWAAHLKGSDRRGAGGERKKDEGEMEGKKRERRCLARE